MRGELFTYSLARGFSGVAAAQCGDLTVMEGEQKGCAGAFAIAGAQGRAGGSRLLEGSEGHATNGHCCAAVGGSSAGGKGEGPCPTQDQTSGLGTSGRH